MIDNKKTERRKNQRFDVPEETYVITSDQAFLGQIEDISASGLSFKYTASHGMPAGLFDSHIFLRDASFHLFDIPSKAVWDIEAGKYHPLSDARIRHCGVRFVALTSGQTSKLQHFIDNYTRRYGP